eukprot:98551-Chlamydomonas_euryale.AAC.1
MRHARAHAWPPPHYSPHPHTIPPAAAVGSTHLSRYIDWFSAVATEKGARSWPKKGLGCSMFAKCAAWPPSCSSVTSAVRPEPICEKGGKGTGQPEGVFLSRGRRALGGGGRRAARPAQRGKEGGKASAKRKGGRQGQRKKGKRGERRGRRAKRKGGGGSVCRGAALTSGQKTNVRM